MREFEPGFPEGLARYGSGMVYEIFQTDVLSDMCHDEVLRECSEFLNPFAESFINAMLFLSEFRRVRREKLAESCGEPNDFSARKAEHFKNMTLYSIAIRAKRRVAEFINAGVEEKVSIQQAKFVAGIAQEASKLLKKV